MAKSSAENPILNDPYREPERYYSTNEKGELDYTDIRAGRSAGRVVSLFGAKVTKVLEAE